ncbi:MAG: sulfite exporter TauE/SafE family protein, partial [Candidatus Omnitrophota bacterium]|nr:sulfite exporter TauE/SafE family protein [Candidatus Omnitrophota bacterium]
QGALRSMFLLKMGLSKENYIATGVVIACLVDLSRLFVYRGSLMNSPSLKYSWLLLLTVLFAFAGVFWGNRLMKKVTVTTVRMITSMMLFAIALLLGAGVI